MKKKLPDLINLYNDYIKRGNFALQRHYSTQLSPLVVKAQGIIPKTGTIDAERMKFNFHGMGCTLDFNGVIVDFDYDVGTFVYSKLDAYKFLEFIQSLDLGYEMTIEDLLKELTILASDG